MAREFRDLVQLILNGEDIASEVVNKPLRRLGGNAEYLFNQFELARVGGTVFARGQTIDSNVKVGQPVYYDAKNNLWARGRAAAEITSHEVVEIASSGQIWGVVHCKLGSTKADLLLIGNVELDLTAAVDGAVEPGQYYLSAIEPGKLVLNPPPVPIPVLKVAGPGQKPGTYVVSVDPNFHDLVGGHEHHKFEMATVPAGIANIIGGVWVITSPDVAVEGWLPAGHASFNGEAPAGAVFGYNLAASTLGDLWPPSPIQSAYSIFNQGSVVVDQGMSPMNELMVVTDCGIWWLSDCLDEVPWPVSVTTTSTTTTTTSSTTTTTSSTTTTTSSTTTTTSTTTSTTTTTAPP